MILWVASILDGEVWSWYPALLEKCHWGLVPHSHAKDDVKCYWSIEVRGAFLVIPPLVPALRGCIGRAKIEVGFLISSFLVKSAVFCPGLTVYLPKLSEVGREMEDIMTTSCWWFTSIRSHTVLYISYFISFLQKKSTGIIIISTSEAG